MTAQERMNDAVQKGEALYQKQLRPLVETPDNVGKILVLDVETGDYAIDSRHLTAIDRLRQSRPQGLFYSLRIGYPALAKMGGGWRLSKGS